MKSCARLISLRSPRAPSWMFLEQRACGEPAAGAQLRLQLTGHALDFGENDLDSRRNGRSSETLDARSPPAARVASRINRGGAARRLMGHHEHIDGEFRLLR